VAFAFVVVLCNQHMISMGPPYPTMNEQMKFTTAMFGGIGLFSVNMTHRHTANNLTCNQILHCNAGDLKYGVAAELCTCAAC